MALELQPGVGVGTRIAPRVVALVGNLSALVEHGGAAGPGSLGVGHVLGDATPKAKVSPRTGSVGQ